MLDGITVRDLQEKLKVDIQMVDTNGQAFIDALVQS
jgi:hypothetical protein